MYFLRARFSKRSEEPSYPLISYAGKMGVTKKHRIVEFEEKLSKEELQKEVCNHFEKYNGKVEYFGAIKYYEFYAGNANRGGELLYTLNTNGEIIENHYFKQLISENFDIPLKELELIEKYEDKYLELFDKLYSILNDKEAILSFVERKNLTVKKIFLAIQKYFEKSEDELWQLSRKVFEVYKENAYKFLR